MVASTRRATLGAILAAPLASVPAVAADPHVAREAEARRLFQTFKDSAWGWGTPSFSPACRAASEDHSAVLMFADEACAMPPPASLAGLGVFALSLALSDEGFTNEPVDMSERRYIALLMAVLNVARVDLPDNFEGLVYRPKDDASCA